MEWRTLQHKIKLECKEQHKNERYTAKYLAYCKNLHKKGFPIISSPEHLARLIGIDYEYLCRMAYAPHYFYREFKIPKSNGESRTISEPLPDLKFVQHWILINILEKVAVSPYAKAFVKRRGVKENARFHRGQNVVLTMDIKDFFPSVNIHDVVDIFTNLGYYSDVANYIAHLCCLDHSLPQGAPTSPYLSNIRLINFDQKVAEYTKPYSIRYTRYADDITLSGDFDASDMIKHISKWLYEDGFKINSRKTRVAHKCARQEVTGIVVNSHMQIPKVDRKKIRQEVYYIQRYGLESHLSRTGNTRQNYLNHLLGKINYARYINPKDTEINEYFIYIRDLLTAYKESQ